MNFVILHHNGHCIHLVQAEGAVHPMRIYLFCQGLENYFEQFKAKGANVDGDLQSFPMGTSEFDVLDPDGHKLTFGEADE